MSRHADTRGRRTIAIVGGGFCGSTLAARLLRSAALTATDIVLIERDPVVGRGVAYARRGFPYLLNVPAGHMSADPHRPDEFLEFARQVRPHARGADFLPRALYGDYLEQRLRRAVAEAPANLRFVRVHGEVTAATYGPRWRLRLGNRDELLADEVVLALGNAAPAPVPGLAGIPVLDPWAALQEVETTHSVLLVGTGLTMVDVALSLEERLRDNGRLYALSRRGLLPRAHRGLGHRPVAIDIAHLLNQADGSLRLLTRAVRRGASGTDGGQSDWHDVFGALRRLAPQLWQRLSARERSRFLRHLRPWWDAHRHRLPAAVAARLERMSLDGTLSVHAGRIESAQVIDERIHVRWRPRAHAHAAQLVIERVINCTGPAHALQGSPQPLIRSLLEARCMAPDALGLGLRTGEGGAVLDAQDRAVDGLFYVGPLLRAKYWEATAVPELRLHVESTAAVLEKRTSGAREVRSGAPALARLRHLLRDAVNVAAAQENFARRDPHYFTLREYFLE